MRGAQGAGAAVELAKSAAQKVLVAAEVQQQVIGNNNKAATSIATGAFGHLFAPTTLVLTLVQRVCWCQHCVVQLTPSQGWHLAMRRRLIQTSRKDRRLRSPRSQLQRGCQRVTHLENMAVHVSMHMSVYTSLRTCAYVFIQMRA